ncbi:hypothetical protein SELMODRAFT_425232 [Selaginella moellendorffii]|uniref:Uncharacterized protein n=1 Tax=Selaginella moellendorffii TaxID=88036 RepID=D8SSF8_SELML|nr:hypothetical protein SELMODRAFT_425232 [Selaginella moellendorffii]
MTVSGGVLALDGVGGGGVMPLATKATFGKLVESYWVHSDYNLNMAIYSSFEEEHAVKLNIACYKINMLNQFVFQAHTLVHDIEHLWFIGMLSLKEPIIKDESASFFKNA